MKTASTVIGTTLLWLIWSGYYNGLMLSFAASSVAIVAWLAARAQLADNWMSRRILGLPRWLIFLIPEIIKANLDIARRVWQRKPDISPTLVEIDCPHQSDFSRALHANSITLTPGTLTIESRPGKLLIHAISREGAESLRDNDSFSRAAGRLE